jgi:hypothetical protein
MLKRINKTALIIFFIFLVGLSLRLAFAPSHNLSADPFEVITSAKTLAETGNYLVPKIGYPDLTIHYDVAGWPVGFPLLLAILFKIFGYSEIIARLFTIFMSSLVIIFTGVISHLLFKNRYITYLSALLVALNPLLVAFNSQIYTENGGLFFLFASITFLLLSVLSDNAGFVNPETILGDKWRLSSFLLAIFLAAFSLTVRETDVIYGLAFAYILYQASFFTNRKTIYLVLLGIIPFALGYSSSLYFNYVNYGSPITSTSWYWHGQGIPLDFRYLLFGTSTSMKLPGGLLIIACSLLYAFPVIFLTFVKKLDGKIKFTLILLLFLLLPLALVYGCFRIPTATPRYILPLIPIASVVSAYAIVNIKKMKRVYLIIIALLVILQQLFLFFPLPVSFSLSPRLGALAMYSPAYNIYSYNNFPDHTNAVVEWVKKNTESDAVVITPSRAYHFYYYAQRDVIILYGYLDVGALAPLVKFRPVYLVEDHETAVFPERIDAFLGSLAKFNLNYKIVDRIPLFSPYIGDTQMKIYRIEKGQGF